MKTMSTFRKATVTAVASGALMALLQNGRSGKMRSSVPSLPQAPTNALVLGSGGLLGAAWMAASLASLEDQGLWEPDLDDLRIGTSAGSLLATLLGHGITAENLIDMLATGKYHSSNGNVDLPLSPTRDNVPFRPSDPGFLIRALASGRAPHLGTVVSSLFAEGLEETDQIEDFVNEISGSRWPETPTWLVAAEIASGVRTVFTKHSGTTPGKAVAASCSVPALFRPVSVGTKRYIDGGTISCHNLDLALESGAKHVTVLTPIFGYTKIDLRSGVNQALNQFVRNSEQFSIDRLRSRLEPNTRLRIVSPGPEASAILTKGSLMNTARMAELIKVSKNEPPQIIESW